MEGLPLTLGENRGLLVAPDNPRASAVGIAGVLRSQVHTDIAAARAYAAQFDDRRIAARYAAIYRDIPRGNTAG